MGKRFILTTEDIIKKGDYRLKIITSGIDLSEFNNNPIMLYGHNDEKVLGTWADLEVTDKIIGTPVFDNDEFSDTIKNKVESGTIKSVSIGIDIKEAYLDGDILVIEKSELLEASIVSIPANKKAKVTQSSKNNIMLFSDRSEIELSKYITKLSEMKKDESKLMDESNDKTDEVIVDVENKIELKDNFKEKYEKVLSEKVVLSNSVSNLNETIKSLESEKEKVSLELSELKAKNIELSSQIDEFNIEKMNSLLDNAIELGKITKESKEDFLELSYDKAKSILDKLSVQTKSLSEDLQLSHSKSEVKTYEWYISNDKAGLKKLSKDNPTLYKQIEETYIKKIK